MGMQAVWKGTAIAVFCGAMMGGWVHVQAGVVGHWPLDDGLLDPNTTVVSDVSGNQRNGQLNNLILPWVDESLAHDGGALNFARQIGYAQIPVGEGLPIDNQPRTLTAWVLAPTASDTKFLSYGGRKSGRAFDFTIELHDGTPHVFFRHWGGNMRYPNAVVGELMHFAAVVPDGATLTSDLQVYLNGQRSLGFRVEGSDWPLLTESSDLFIGARSDVFDFFGGLVDDVWLFDEALDEFSIRSVMRGTYGILPGDFNTNGQLDVDDLNRLTDAVTNNSQDMNFDIDGNRLVESNDRNVWIHALKQTYLGDANLDGLFDSGDLVAVFQGGEFEDDVAHNSTWDEGDWDGDGDFGTEDFVVAFVDGGYEIQTPHRPDRRGRAGTPQLVPRAGRCVAGRRCPSPPPGLADRTAGRARC